MLASVGTPKYDNNPRELKPEYGLLALRKTFKLIYQYTTNFVFNTLSKYSSLKADLINDLDIVIIRELIGDVYFGEPEGFKDVNGDRVGYNTMLYSESEVQRITEFAIETAKKEIKKLHRLIRQMSLNVSQLWRQTVDRMMSGP